MHKILITGAAGFIGSHLTELCVKKGFDVTAFVHYNSRNQFGWLENLEIKNEIEIYKGDIRDYDSVHSAMKQCDTVFHLAALIGIPYSYLSPLAYIKTNIEGTYNVFQACRHSDINSIIVTSTSETYGTAQYAPIDEDHPLVGQSPYSASKIGADQLAISFYKSFDIPVKIIRPFNTYGPRQSSRAVIPTIISQILKGKRQLVLGNIKPTRDFTFVKDTAKAFIEVSNVHEMNGDVVNVGMGKEVSVENLVDLICGILCVNVEINTENERVRPRKSEVERLLCNNSKLIEYTNWQPTYSLRRGLEETINWFKKNLSYYKPEIYGV